MSRKPFIPPKARERLGADVAGIKRPDGPKHLAGTVMRSRGERPRRPDPTLGAVLAAEREREEEERARAALRKKDADAHILVFRRWQKKNDPKAYKAWLRDNGTAEEYGAYLLSHGTPSEYRRWWNEVGHRFEAVFPAPEPRVGRVETAVSRAFKRAESR